MFELPSRLFTFLIEVYLSSFYHYCSSNLESVQERESAFLHLLLSSDWLTHLRLVVGDHFPSFTSTNSSGFSLFGEFLISIIFCNSSGSFLFLELFYLCLCFCAWFLGSVLIFFYSSVAYLEFLGFGWSFVFLWVSINWVVFYPLPLMKRVRAAI